MSEAGRNALLLTAQLENHAINFSNLPLQAIHLVEKKLQMAIRGEYRTRLARSRRNVNGDGAEDGGTVFTYRLLEFASWRSCSFYVGLGVLLLIRYSIASHLFYSLSIMYKSLFPCTIFLRPLRTS